MLTEQEKKELNHEISKYELRQAACLEGLLIVQHHRGYVSDESVKDVAEYVGMSPTELDGIATFYNRIHRRPVGRHVVKVCDSVSCWIMGYEQIVTAIWERFGIKFGQTAQDNRFTLLPTQCLGTCDKAPALMVGNDLHRNLTPQSVIEILEKYE